MVHLRLSPNILNSGQGGNQIQTPSCRGVKNPECRVKSTGR